MQKLASIFAVMAVVGCVVSFQLWRQLQLAHADAARQQASLPAMTPEQGIGQKPGRGSGRSPVTGDAPLLPTASPQEAEAPAATSTAAQHRSLGELMKDPGFRAAQQAQARQMAPRAYPDLAEELGLSEEEASALLDLLVDQQMGALAGSGDTSAEAVQARIEQSARREAAVQELLGARYARWRDYRQSLGARQRVAHVRRAMDSASLPLSDPQAKAFLQQVIAEQDRYVAETRWQTAPVDPADQIKATRERNKRLLDSAATILNPGQLELLRTTLDHDLNVNRAVALQLGAQSRQGNMAGN